MLYFDVVVFLETKVSVLKKIIIFLFIVAL